jgi:ATP-dependent DNA helicase PIF1
MLFLKRLVSWSSPPFTARACTRTSTSMLKQAVQQCSPPALPPPATKTQKPLQPNLSLNSQKSFTAKKRKLERTMSSTGSLGALHMTTGFGDENTFDGDRAAEVGHNGSSVPYPSLPNSTSNISYPTLPTSSSHSGLLPPDSPAVPWSSSPPEHYQPPPCKRRTIPWSSEQESEPASVPPPIDKAHNSSYLWNGHSVATKAKRNQPRKIEKPRYVPSDQNEVPKPKTSTVEPVKNFLLSNEQKAILSAVVDKGKSVFFTGSAGTGKSVLMRSIIKKLRDRYIKEPDRLAVTASTGLAAVNIDGSTLHSFAGIGLGKEPATELLRKIKRNGKTRLRWTRTKVLIIDEVSMIDGDLFDKLEQIARSLRGNGSPVGGIQLVVTGDFFQLPPVAEKDRVAKFSFDSATWNTCIEHTILLTDVFRQKDATFAGMLNEMRLGRLTPASIKSFQSLSRGLNFTDDLEATEL